MESKVEQMTYSEVMDFAARAARIAGHLIRKYDGHLDQIKTAANQIADEELRQEVIWNICWFEAMPQCWPNKTSECN